MAASFRVSAMRGPSPHVRLDSKLAGAAEERNAYAVALSIDKVLATAAPVIAPPVGRMKVFSVGAAGPVDSHGPDEIALLEAPDSQP
jgi:hypothetical protein